MLATGPAAVKFDVPPTPEQQACSRAIDQGLTAFWTLVERLHAASEARQPIHQVEELIFRDLLAMGHSLLGAFVASAGDGKPALHEHQAEFLPAGAVCILDLFHVLEYLWKAAWCFFDEASEKPRAETWVEAKLRALLEGRVASVIRGLRVLATRRGLKGQPRRTVEQVTGYLERDRQRMKYDEYLAAGYYYSAKSAPCRIGGDR